MASSQMEFRYLFSFLCGQLYIIIQHTPHAGDEAVCRCGVADWHIYTALKKTNGFIFPGAVLCADCNVYARSGLARDVECEGRVHPAAASAWE